MTDKNFMSAERVKAINQLSAKEHVNQLRAFTSGRDCFLLSTVDGLRWFSTIEEAKCAGKDQRYRIHRLEWPSDRRRRPKRELWAVNDG